MKKLMATILCSMLLLSSCAKKEPIQTPVTPKPTGGVATIPVTPSPAPVSYKASDFFPTSKDVHIKYKGTGNEYAEFETYVEYVKEGIVQLRTDNGGTSMVSVYVLDKEAFKRVFARPETYYRYDFTSSRNTDEILIKEPIAAGTSWTLKDGAKRTITAVDVDMKTPHGNYKALEVTTEREDSTYKDYYSKGIGLIKSVFTSKDSKYIVTSEIEKLEKDVPFKHNVRFYFPNPNNDKLRYFDRTVEINTNQDMKFKFQKELKTIPEGSGLIKVLSANVQVLGSVVDESKGIVTVDFSSQLTKEMNLGAGFEGLVLKSIANTFGSYYDVDKAIITIEGKPYSSGHIIMKPGEYLKVDR